MQLVVPPAEPKFEESTEAKEPTPMIDLQIELGKKLGKEAPEYFKKLAAENPSHLATLVARLESLDDTASDEDVEKASNAIFTLIDESELARHCGTRSPERMSTEEKKRDKQANAEKSALCLAFERKGARLQKKYSDSSSNSDTSFVEASAVSGEDQPYSDVTTLLKAWRRWASSENDSKLALATAREHLAHGRYGSALVSLQRVLDDLGNTQDQSTHEARTLVQEALTKLDWPLLYDLNVKKALIREPPQGYALW